MPDSPRTLPGCPWRPWLDEPLPEIVNGRPLRKLRRFGWERREHETGRVLVSLFKGHRFANSAGQQRRYRLVAAYALNSLPPANEHVDHLNGRVDDDRLENLRLLAASYHGSLHAELRDLGGFRGPDGTFIAALNPERIPARRFKWVISPRSIDAVTGRPRPPRNLDAAPKAARSTRGRRVSGSIFWPRSTGTLAAGRECMVREIDLADASYPLRDDERGLGSEAGWSFGWVLGHGDGAVLVRLFSGRIVGATQVAVAAHRGQVRSNRPENAPPRRREPASVPLFTGETGRSMGQGA